MVLGAADKAFILTTAKEILITALDKTNPFAMAFTVKEANEIGDVFNALVNKVAQSFKTLG